MTGSMTFILSNVMMSWGSSQDRLSGLDPLRCILGGKRSLWGQVRDVQM